MNDPTLISIVSQFDIRLAAVLGWIILCAKVFVDWIKTATVLPTWAPPLACFLASAVIVVLAMVALGVPTTQQLLAQAILLAIVATIVAIGSTVLQSKAKSTAPEMITGELQDGPSLAMQVADELERRMKETPAGSSNWTGSNLGISTSSLPPAGHQVSVSPIGPEAR